MGYLALLFYFVLEYLRPGVYIPAIDATHLNSLVPLFVVILTLTAKTPVSNEESLREINSKLIVAFFGIIFVSFLFATITERAYDVLKMVLGYIMIYWALTRQVGDIKRLKGVFIVLILVHVAVALLNPVMFTDPEGRHTLMSGAFIGDGNDYALSVNVCIPFCLFLILDSKSKLAKGFWLALMLLLVISIVATKSRGGTVAMAAMGLHYWLKSQRKAITAGVFAVVVATILVVAPPSYFERMGTISDTEDGSTVGRIVAWSSAVKMAVRSPFLGAGAGHFPVAFGALNEGRWMTAHSIYFLILGELGFPGILMLFALIFVNLSVNRRVMREVEKSSSPEAARMRNVLMCTSASLIAFAAGGAFLSAIYYPHLYVLLGLLAVGRRLARVELEGRNRVSVVPAAVMLPAAGGMIVQPGHISPEWRPRLALNTRRMMGRQR